MRKVYLISEVEYVHGSLGGITFWLLLMLILARLPGSDPFIDLAHHELLQPAVLVNGHSLSGDTFVNGVLIDPEMRCNLVH